MSPDLPLVAIESLIPDGCQVCHDESGEHVWVIKTFDVNWFDVVLAYGDTLAEALENLDRELDDTCYGKS
jgi:hypothetical protein